MRTQGDFDGGGFIVETDDGIEYCESLTGDENEVYRKSTKHEDFLYGRLRECRSDLKQAKLLHVEAVNINLSCHNVANKLDAMGVDGLKAIEGLVGLVSSYKVAGTIDNNDAARNAAMFALDAFMQSIQRKDDDV